MIYWQVVNGQNGSVVYGALTGVEAREIAARLTRDYQTPYVAVKKGPF